MNRIITRVSAGLTVTGALLVLLSTVSALLLLNRADGPIGWVGDGAWPYLSVLAFAMACTTPFIMLAVYAVQVDEAGVLGLVGLMISVVGLLGYVGYQFDMAFVWPALAEQAPELLEFDGPLFRDPRFGFAHVWMGVVHTVGVLLFGAALIRARVYPRPASVLFMIGLILSVGGLSPPFLISAVGGIVAAPGLMWMGLLMWKRPECNLRRALQHEAPELGMNSRLTIAVCILSVGSAQAEERPGSGLQNWEPAEVQLAAARQHGLDVSISLALNDSVEVDLVLIPPGEFQMGTGGSPETTAERWPGSPSSHFELEHPQHRVEISRPFYMGVTEVTRTQWYAVMGGEFPAPEVRDHPVAHVTWDEAIEFTEQLSRIVARTVDLPSEAQWEFAARAGTTEEFSFGNSFDTRHANCEGAGLLPVGSFPPNAWGLNDVHGNVVEWVKDGYGSYSPEDQVDPEGPEHVGRMLRGGGYDDEAAKCRSAYRYAHGHWAGDQVSGLRVVFAPGFGG